MFCGVVMNVLYLGSSKKPKNYRKSVLLPVSVAYLRVQHDIIIHRILAVLRFCTVTLRSLRKIAHLKLANLRKKMRAKAKFRDSDVRYGVLGTQLISK